MGIPPLNSVLGVSDDGSFRATVIEAVEHCPDLEVCFVETPAAARSHLAATPADCLLVDAHVGGQPLVEFRARLHADHPTLPVVVAVDTPRTLPAALATHSVVEKADPAVTPEVVRILTTNKRTTHSPPVSAEQH